MTTPLNLYAHLWDIDAGAIATVTVSRTNLSTHVVTTGIVASAVASNSMIFAWALGKRRNAAGTLKIGVAFGNAFANAVIDAMGGPTYKGALKKYLIRVSRDGGTSFCSYAWLEGVRITLDGAERGIIVETADAFSGFDKAQVDHMSFNSTPLYAVLDGAPGSIPITTDPLNASGGTTVAGNTFPGSAYIGLRGLDNTQPLPPTAHANTRNITNWYFLPDTSHFPFVTTPISADILDDTVSNALLTVMRAASGKYDSSDPVPLGARAHYHVDIANRIVRCGYVGTASKLNVVSELAAGVLEPDETTTAVFNVSKLVIAPGTEQKKAQAYMLGGGSNHGMPDGAKITGIETLFVNVGGDLWYNNLPILACATGADGGGVFYNPHTGALYPLSQTFDVTCLVLDGTTHRVYAGTPYGVYYWDALPPDGLNAPRWQQLGTLTGNVISLQVPIAGTVWALVSTGSGTTGVFESPPRGGEDNTALGFGGWSQIVHGGNTVAMGGGIGNLYYVDAADTTTIIWQQGSGTAPTKVTGFTGGVTGIDYLPTLTRIVVRTTAGSAGIYSIALGSSTLVDLNGDGSLVDRFGSVIVNRVQQSNAGKINQSTVTLLAATDQGVFWTGATPGSGSMNWQQMTGQTGIGQRNVTFAVASPTQVVLGRSFERVYAASDTAYYVSNSGGIWFKDFLNAPLDLGPYWYALARASGGWPFPSNAVGALGNGPLVANNGGTGTVLSIPGGTESLPTNWVWARRLTGLNDFSFREVIVDSAAPYFATELQELAEITADDSRGAITASQQLALAHTRYLLENGQAPLTLNLENLQYRIQEAALATLITGDLLHLTCSRQQTGPDGTITQIVNWSNEPFYALQYDEVLIAGGLMEVTLQVGSVMTLLLSDTELLQDIVGGTSYGLSRDKRYRRIR